MAIYKTFIFMNYMGYHIILDCECTVKKEYASFVRNKFAPDGDPNTLMMSALWEELDFEEYCNITFDDYLKIQIKKKPHLHKHGRLQEDYVLFLRKIIAVIFEEIIFCEISHDDYDIPPTFYMDDDLRNLTSTTDSISYLSKKVRELVHTVAVQQKKIERLEKYLGNLQSSDA